MRTVEDLGARGRSDSMKILVACEESQEVTKELRRLGHEAYSCDIIPCSGGASRVAFTSGCIRTPENEVGHDPSISTMYISDKCRRKTSVEKP